MDSCSPEADLLLFSRLLNALDVELLHLHHGLHDALDLLLITVCEQFHQHLRRDLPKQSKLVLEPAAFNLLTTFGKFLPKVVDFLLRLTMNDERHGLGEFELRPTIEGGELLTVELEGYGHDRPLWPRAYLAIAGCAQDFGILENGDVEIHRFLSVVVLPK